MRTKFENSAFRKILEEINKNKKIKEKHLVTLEKIYGTRFLRALEIIKERQVKKYVFKPSNRVVWIVIGKKRDYQIMPNAGFCSCDDFYYNVIEKKTYLCYHLISQKIAESLKEYDLISENDNFYNPLISEWRKIVF
jgi:predicted nucleic acid-binding Zn finger protein